MDEARKRSVNNLQRVYTVVISLAVAESLRRLFSPVVTSGQLPSLGPIVAVISMLFTIIPFYHGANRYLDSTYVTGERSAKAGALMLDFVIIFIEGLAFFVISLLINNPEAFYSLLACLFLLDAGWVWLTRLTSESPPEKGAGYAIWSVVNVAAAFLLLLSTWSNLLDWNFWKTSLAETVAVGVISVFRTFIDYYTVWDFYYPPSPESRYIMPVPRPAIPPQRNPSIPADLADVNIDKIGKVADVVRSIKVPPEMESSTHAFDWPGNNYDLANCYLAIVAICHQTSPQGEPRLIGNVAGLAKEGWDYLKERYLIQAISRPELADPAYWSGLSPQGLSGLYEDSEFGNTLSRVTERTRLLNDLGQKLVDMDVHHIYDPFNAHERRIGGESGFLQYLLQFESYSDPLSKKAFFFLSLAITECGWEILDPESLLSPIDYHELRGHLRIGTIVVKDGRLGQKLGKGLPIDYPEDISLRSAAQRANSMLSDSTNVSDSALHYLLWNVFRNCCPRESAQTHCSECGNSCRLPPNYATMEGYSGHCIFSGICNSSGKADKIVDPPYSGHYY
jgi:hypothetical protein